MLIVARLVWIVILVTVVAVDCLNKEIIVFDYINSQRSELLLFRRGMVEIE